MHLEITLNSKKSGDVTNAEKELATFRTHEKDFDLGIISGKTLICHSERENELLFFSHYGGFRNLVFGFVCATIL
ncbi:MAG: hypothetical protein U0T78_07600 [Cloacibacterium normanense]